MALGPLPPNPRLSGVPRRLPRPLPPLLLLCPIGSLLSAGRGCQVPQSRGCSIFTPPHSELHWDATVSLEASRLLPSRLVGFLLPPPPTFNHLFTAVTQRKASPGGNPPNQHELGLFGAFLGWGANQQGGETWAVWQEEILTRRRCTAAENFLSNRDF